MRLESVKLVNFGSHAARTWEPGNARLSVIVGPNGAGKSTLLVDGPLFALFGEVPGGYAPDQLVRIGSTEMSVTIELALDGIRYRVIRRRTTRAGGKSSADLQAQAPDGSWTPVASGAREVTAEATRLLRMDQSTFRTAVVLAQGDAQRFLEATPGKGTPTAPGRAAVLSTIVVDPRFALAEVVTREEARDLEAATAADRRAVETLDLALVRRPELEEAAAAATSEEEAATAAMEAAGRRRDAAEEAMRALSGRLAEAKAAQEELARIAADHEALKARYQRTAAGRTEAKAAADRARPEAAAEIPEVDVDAARAEVSRLEAAADREREYRAELDAARTAFRELEAAHERTVAVWRRDHATAAALVSSLEDQAAHLDPVTCPKCRTRFPADPGDVAGRLDLAREELHAVGPEPAEPLAVGRTRGLVTRAESRLAEEAVDPMAMRAAREALAAAERVTAALATREAARASLTEAEAALARADVELAEIETAGKASAERKAAAVARANEADQVAADLAAAEAERGQAIGEATQAARRHAAAIAADAEARSALARLAADQAERDRIAGQIAEAETTLDRLRRLLVAFGVKGIPARVVEGVLPELVAHANEMLGQLRPGMTLDVRATRAKANGSGTIEALDIWIRDERGERQRWSGGEATSIAMSIAIALSRLGARRSGARVATLVIDEPDGLDSESRRAFGQALRVLAHRGDLERVAVITHQDGIPDFADDVVEIERDEEPATPDIGQVA